MANPHNFVGLFVSYEEGGRLRRCQVTMYIRIHGAKLLNTSNIGDLGPTSCKLLRGPDPIRDTEGLVPFSEVPDA